MQIMNYILLLFIAVFVSILVLPVAVYGFTQPVGLGLLVFGPWLFIILSGVYSKIYKWLQKRSKV